MPVLFKDQQSAAKVKQQLHDLSSKIVYIQQGNPSGSEPHFKTLANAPDNV